MKLRHLQQLALVASLAIVIGGTVSAQAAVQPGTRAGRSTTNVQFVFGPPAPFAGTRFDGAFDPASRRIYFLGFRAADNSTDGSVWYFDLTTRQYVDTGVDMPLPVSNYQVAPLSDARGLGFYIFGGRDGNGNIVTDVQVYYPAVNQATIVSTDPWPGTSPSGCVTLPGMGVAVVSNRAIVMGGASFASSGCLDDNSAQTWIYNPKGTPGTRWSQGPDLNLARGYITPAVSRGRVFAIGGDVNVAGTLFAQSIVEAWQPFGGTWNDAGIADLPEACDESQAFANAAGSLAGTIVLAGCGQWPSALGDVLQYTSSTNSWAIVAQLNEIRRNQAGEAIPPASNPIMYILGGYASDGFTALSTSELGQGGASAPRHASRGAGTASSKASTT